MTIFNVLTWSSAGAFMIYGFLCLFTGHMKIEFERYGLSRFRSLVGVLEILGGVALLVGFFYPLILSLASAALSVLMLLGLRARLKVGDPFPALIPAFVLMLLNLWLFVESIKAQ